MSGVVERALLVVIVGVYLVVGALYATQTPPWQAPDEPAHYNYIAQVAEHDCCPVIEVGDWNQAYIGQLTSERFRSDLLGDLDTLQYEDHQPPLYYLLASLVFKLTSGSLVALRLFSVVIGAGVVWSAYAVGRTVVAERPQIAVGAAAFVAFLPQHVHMLAAVNNDGLAELVIGLTLLATIRYLREATNPVDWRQVVAPGTLVGVGFVTKASTYFLAAVVPMAILTHWWIERRKAQPPEAESPPASTKTWKSAEADWEAGRRGLDSEILGVTSQAASGLTSSIAQGVSLGMLVRALMLFFAPALILGSLWWVRNVNVYGFPDFLGLGRHNLVVADQPRTADDIAQIGWDAYLNKAVVTTFNSFWGQFGWMAWPLDGRLYTVIQLFLLGAIAGLALDAFVLHRERWRRMTLADWSIWLVLGFTLALATLQYVYYNTEFLQLQGRYLFTALIPLGLLLAVGVDAWREAILGRWKWTGWLTVAVFVGLVVLDFYALWGIVIPLLSV